MPRNHFDLFSNELEYTVHLCINTYVQQPDIIMILLSFWDPAEHLILLTEFLLLEKVQEEEWLHLVHTLDKHATKQKNKKIIVKKKSSSH